MNALDIIRNSQKPYEQQDPKISYPPIYRRSRFIDDPQYFEIIHHDLIEQRRFRVAQQREETLPWDEERERRKRHNALMKKYDPATWYKPQRGVPPMPVGIPGVETISAISTLDPEKDALAKAILKSMGGAAEST